MFGSVFVAKNYTLIASLHPICCFEFKF